MNSESFNYYMPRTTLIGVNCVERIGKELLKRNVKRCLLVTDEFMADSPVMKEIKVILDLSGIYIIIYCKVKPNPTLSQVSEGVKEFLSGKCDSIISLGGGSPHDCAKAIKLCLLKSKLTSLNSIPLMAINTTAGTASEVTRFAIITDEREHYKLSIIDEDAIPDVAVDDPRLMLGMPGKLTAATGMDALTHAVEAYVAKGRNPITDCTALKSIELINKYLLRAYKRGNDIEAREGMVYAQYLAGMAFSNSGLGLVHAMAHQLGGMYNLPHGLCNAVLLPYVVNFNKKGSYKGYAHIAKTINVCSAAMPDKTASNAFVRYILNLNKELIIPKTIKELGVKYEDCRKLAEMAMKDTSLQMNPVQIGEDEIKGLYEAAFNGRLEV
ncbi:MAG: iron-containing alcohol dehydrogenase [Ruminiclostridium sp.]